ncbi:MAG TPA: alpha/beta fold hydrolase [Candidatus Aquilonibacter sp.]|nr:alpha/beta fold hydrolase [Candidatus Aquilonibacter sp.]
MPALVFLHGAGCLPAVFDLQAAAFPDAIIPALPGHGVPGSPRSVGEFADAIERVLQTNGLRDAVLVGSSMGGAIALELALRHHPSVRGIVLLGSSAKLRVAPAIFDAIDTDFPAAARMLAGYFFADARPEWIDGAVAQMLAVGQAQTRRDFEACNSFDVLERLPEIAVPVLALTGEKDVMVPPKFAAAAADRIPGGQARIVPDAGHLLFIERPAETNDAVRAFVHTIAS